MILAKLKESILKKLKKKKITKKSPKKTHESPPIKKIHPFNIEVFNYFNNISGEEKKNSYKINEFVQKNHQNFKKLTLDNQLKILFYYIKINSNNGLFKRPSLRSLGEFFGNVDKNTISKRLKMLEKDGYISKYTDIEIKKMKDTYKILKEDF